MRPLPWSHSALTDFKNCPKAFHAKRVIKSVKEEQSDQLIWGNIVHKAFEDRIHHERRVPLPPNLETHEPFMDDILSLAGTTYTERKIALNTNRQPCGFFDQNVWMRGVIDVANVYQDGALLVDYKTGRPHANFAQLKLFALHTFAEFPQVNFVTVKFYWTQTLAEDEDTYTRDQIAELWNEFVPDLKQYVEAFKTDTWQARPSGLCKGWCPVTSCEHWSSKRGR